MFNVIKIKSQYCTNKTVILYCFFLLNPFTSSSSRYDCYLKLIYMDINDIILTPVP